MASLGASVSDIPQPSVPHPHYVRRENSSSCPCAFFTTSTCVGGLGLAMGSADDPKNYLESVYTVLANSEGAKKAGARPKWRLAVALCVEMARQWTKGGGAFDCGAYVKAQHISGRLVANVMGVLSEAGIVAETGDESGVFVLLRSPEKITVGEIVSAIADYGTPPESLGLSKTEGPLRDYFACSDQRLSEHLSVTIASLAS